MPHNNFPEEVCWIGARQSDATECGLFSHSIVTYGNPGNDCDAFCSVNKRPRRRSLVNEESFIRKSMEKVLQKNPSSYFLFYDQNEAYKFHEYSDKIMCANEHSLLKTLDSKIYTNLWFGRQVDVLDFRAQIAKTITYKSLLRDFPGVNRFVLRMENDAGGHGTHLLSSEEDVRIVLGKHDGYKRVIVSPWIDGCSISQHVLITNDETICFAPAKQLFNADSFLFAGVTFNEKLDKSALEKTQRYSIRIGELLRVAGYRGIAGIDYIIFHGEPKFLEINPRYMGSTIMLEHSLLTHDLPSIHELNFQSFYGSISNELADKCRSLEIQGTVNYINWTPKKYEWPPIDGAHLYYEHIDNDTFMYRDLILHD